MSGSSRNVINIGRGTERVKVKKERVSNVFAS